MTPGGPIPTTAEIDPRLILMAQEDFPDTVPELPDDLTPDKIMTIALKVAEKVGERNVIQWLARKLATQRRRT